MDTEQRKAFTSRVREARKAQRYTQRQLADAAGVSLGMVSNLERGVHVPQGANLEAILRVLGIGGDPEATRESWPVETGIFLDAIGAYLNTMSPKQRLTKIHAMTRMIFEANGSARSDHDDGTSPK